MARVFLSGTYEDRPALRRLAEALRRAGHESRMGDDLVHDLVIWTGDELVPGMGLSAALERALARSDALIIGYSAAAARRGFPRHDLDAFRKAGASKPVFVVRLDHTPLPSDLFDTVAFDLHRDSWNRDIEPLAAALAPSTPSFVDREAELAWLARHLRAGAPVAVVGEFGVGKTALVAEYVRRHAAEYPGGYRVIQADPDFERLVGEARSAQTERSLLVIEELDRHASSGIQHLSDGDPHTIVIARTPPVEFPGPVLELAPLSHADALQLFELRTGPTDDPRESQKRDQIVTALGGMPRAIVLAADQYRRGWLPAGGATALAPLIAAKAPPGSPERSLLEGMLPFAGRAVPIQWAALIGEAGSQTEAAAVARRLESAGLVQLDPDSDVSLHPVAREALRELVAPEAWRRMHARAAEIATRWMMDALAHKIVPDEPVLEHIEALASDDDDEAQGPWQGALQERLAAFHRRRGDQARELQLLERARRNTACHRAAYGDLHAIVTAQLASHASGRGDLDSARQALAEALATAQSQPADGSVRWREVDPEAYREALEAALETAEALNDPSSEARAVFLLGDFHGRRGAWERAIALAEQALRAARRANEPTLIARAYRLQADAALHGSHYEDARASYEEAIRRLDELGAEELAATTRVLYINLLLQLNRRDEASRHAERLRGYLARAPAGWPYHEEAAQTLRLFYGSATEGEG